MFSTKNQLIESTFGGRLPAVESDGYLQFFRDAGVADGVACGVKRVLEDVLGADLSRLRSNDDFSTNLGFFIERDSMADVEIVVELERRFDINISDEEARGASSVEDVVLLVWGKVAHPGSQRQITHSGDPEQTERGG